MPDLSLFSLEGKKALVTGASRGLGRAIALALARAGADVAVVSRSPEDLQRVALEIEALGQRGVPIAADVSREEEVEAMRDEALKALGTVHILVNNAGTSLRKPVLQMTLEEWERVLRTNLTAYFLVARALGPTMLAQRWGRVINMASLRVHLTSPGLAAYASTKGAIVPFTKTLALEWVDYNVKVNAIAPGYFDTPLVAYVKDLKEVYEATVKPITMGRWGRPEEVGGVAVFLASEASNYLTGQVIFVDGGRLAWS